MDYDLAASPLLGITVASLVVWTVPRIANVDFKPLTASSESYEAVPCWVS